MFLMCECVLLLIVAYVKNEATDGQHRIYIQDAFRHSFIYDIELSMTTFSYMDLRPQIVSWSIKSGQKMPCGLIDQHYILTITHYRHCFVLFPVSQ